MKDKLSLSQKLDLKKDLENIRGKVLFTEKVDRAKQMLEKIIIKHNFFE